MPVEPFQIRVEDSILTDLRERLARTRYIPSSLESDWRDGTDPEYLRALCESWRTNFDWRKRESYLNSFPQFRTAIDGFGLHFLHVKSSQPTALPLLLLHGWPDSFTRYVKLIPLLTEPDQHGLQGQPAFEVIVPSLPGFGFSDKPSKPAYSFTIAALLNTLMTKELGFARYAVHGGDWGAVISEDLARRYPSSLYGIHITDVPAFHLFQHFEGLGKLEEDYRRAAMLWKQRNGTYVAIQNSRPRTLSSGLNDSPAGLAAWIVEKFRDWSDCDGRVERSFSRDEILTNLTIYWVTQTIDSSFQLYYDFARFSEKLLDQTGVASVPAAFAVFPRDPAAAPRAWAQRFFNIQRWTTMQKGGHFGAMEAPEALARDLQDTFNHFTTKLETE